MNICDSSKSAKFANMGFVCTCLVVLDHVMLDGTKGAAWLVCELFGHVGVVRIAVPFFFFASGYWLSGHFMGGDYKIAFVWRRELMKRVKTLLVPYLFFNALCWLYLLLVHGVASKLGYQAHISPPPPFNLDRKSVV